MFKFIDFIEDWFLALSLGFMLLLNFTNVLTRYFLHMSFSFTEELTTNLFVLSCFFGAAAAAKRGAHLGLSIVTDALPGHLQRWVRVIVTLMTLTMFGVMIWTGIEMVQSQLASNQKTPALNIPEWMMGLTIPIGGLLCFIRFAQAGWRDWQKGGGQ